MSHFKAENAPDSITALPQTPLAKFKGAYF